MRNLLSMPWEPEFRLKRAKVASQAVVLGGVGAALSKGIDGAGLFFDQVYWRSNELLNLFQVFREG
jgi:hypothetical protein